MCSMKRRFWGLLLVVVLMVTSLDMTVFAIETESKEDVQVQKDEIEQKNEAEQIESEEIAEAVKQTDDAGEIEELDAIVETQDSEYISDNSNQMTTEVYEKSVEGKEMQEIILLQEPTGNRESSYDVTVEEKQEQMSNTGEETGSSIGDKGNEEMQSEKTEIDADVAASYERISRVSRDDGIWLFPLGKSYWNRFTDWAGCPGYSKCSFCGKVHNSWGDSAHTGQSYGHNGFDIGASIGTPVLAAASGTVAHTSIGNNGGRGNFVVIEHSISGTSFSYYSYYQYLNSISVSKGASVKAGDTIAKSGNSGIGTGAHLHFGIVMAQKGINIGSRLGSIENKGWVTSGENKEGRILVNPSTKQQSMPTGSASVIPPLAYHSGSVTYTFDKSKVTVGTGSSSAASALQIKGQSSPGNLNVGSRWTCKGTISSNYTITHVGGYILQSDNSTIVQSKTVNPNATSYSLENGVIDRALLFNTLPVGTYYYKITAHDASGKRLTLIDDKFTVTAPVPKPCNFSGQITAPADWAAFQTSTVKITATATDSYAINNFIIKLYNSDGITLLKTEIAAANKSGDAYLCNYDLNLSEQKTYTVAVSAICANGREHFIDSRHFTYDATPPVISNLNVYKEGGDFYCTANVSDSVTGVVNAAMVIRDEGGIEKNFDCKIVSDTVMCIWSDINGLWTSGKYVITLYVQDKAGNIGYAALQDIVLAEVSSGPKRVDIVVGEEKEVNITINTLFKTEGKNQTQKTVCK